MIGCFITCFRNGSELVKCACYEYKKNRCSESGTVPEKRPGSGSASNDAHSTINKKNTSVGFSLNSCDVSWSFEVMDVIQ